MKDALINANKEAMPMLEFSSTRNAGVAMRCLDILHHSLSATPLALETKIKCVGEI